MNDALTIARGLFENAAVVLSMVALIELSASQREVRRPYPLIAGLIMGLTACISMTIPIPVADGIIIGIWPYVLGLAGLFFGRSAAGLALALTIGLRVFTGGAGVWAGVGAMASATAIGLAARRLFGLQAGRPLGLLLMGLATAVVTSSWCVLLPAEVAWSVFVRLLPSQLGIAPLAITLIGLLLQMQRRGHVHALKLTQVEANQRALIASLPDSVLFVHAEGRLEDPPAFFKRAPSPLNGLELSGVLSPSDFAGLKPVINGQTSAPSRVEFRHDGRDYEAVVAPMAGEAVGGVCVARDVTEARSLEAQLRQSQKLEVVGRLAGGISHDFNNLLAVIKANADLIREHESLSLEAAEEMEELSVATDNAAALSRQLLAFSRQNTTQARPIELTSKLKTAVSMLAKLLPRNIEVQMTPGDEGWVTFDAVQLEQVILNLGINARDAMPDGGRLTFSVEAQNGALLLHIEDTGEGIPEDQLKCIFEPFYTTKVSGRGTGLGLAMVRRIMKGAGGDISVQSTLGAGTQFTLRFPRPDRAGTPPVLHQPASSARPRLSGERVLLVDDEPSVRRTLARMLERAGLKVTAVGDAEAALACLSEGFEVLVTDLSMPGCDGGTLARRSLERCPKLAVVIISGHVETSCDLEGLTQAVFLQKPFGAGAMLQAVKQSLTPRGGSKTGGESAA